MSTPLEIHEIRRLNLIKLLSGRGAKTQLATRLDVQQGYITHLLDDPSNPQHRAIREESARQIEQVMGWEAGKLDIDPDSGTRIPSPSTVPAPASTERRASPPVDADLLEESVKIVISTATETHANLLAEKTAGMVRIVYEHSRSTGKVDPLFVAQLVKLLR